MRVELFYCAILNCLGVMGLNGFCCYLHISLLRV